MPNTTPNLTGTATAAWLGRREGGAALLCVGSPDEFASHSPHRPKHLASRWPGARLDGARRCASGTAPTDAAPHAACAAGRGGHGSLRCWFNQIAFLNEWTLDAELHEYLVDIYGEAGLPFNTRFGNGDPVGADVVQLINDVYEANTARERWQRGDLMLVDNVRTAHARECFQGPREVLVAMVRE